MTDLDEALRAGAGGMLADQAAVELLIRAGGFVHRGAPWIRESGAAAFVDPEALLRESGGLGGGARRIAAVAAALLGGERVDLVDAASGLDRASLDLVLAAIAHAGGSHESAEPVLVGGELVGFSTPASLHPWPGEQGVTAPAPM